MEALPARNHEMFQCHGTQAPMQDWVAVPGAPQSLAAAAQLSHLDMGLCAVKPSLNYEKTDEPFRLTKEHRVMLKHSRTLVVSTSYLASPDTQMDGPWCKEKDLSDYSVTCILVKPLSDGSRRWMSAVHSAIQTMIMAQGRLPR